MDNKKFLQEIYIKYNKERTGRRDSFYSSHLYRTNKKIVLQTAAMFSFGVILLISVLCAGVMASKYLKSLSMKPSYTAELGESDMNDVWIGTFQLIWNDAMDTITHGPIEFTDEPSKLADELNKRSFTQEMLSSDSYYKILGIANLELKEKIEKDLQEKFQDYSKILDRFSWEREWLYLIQYAEKRISLFNTIYRTKI